MFGESSGLGEPRRQRRFGAVVCSGGCRNGPRVNVEWTTRTCGVGRFECETVAVSLVCEPNHLDQRLATELDDLDGRTPVIGELTVFCLDGVANRLDLFDTVETGRLAAEPATPETNTP